ncbi:hypothetical protein J4E81_001196 [Alternaria sp. BMP 2799]|nr:hypothetical protein J4E81_001196 [Alternaria sp. BMP 2799]
MEIRGVVQIDSVYHYQLGRNKEVVRVAVLPQATEQLRKLLDHEAELVIEERSSAKREHVDPADPGIPPIYSQWENWKAIMDRRKKQDHRDGDSARNENSGLATCRISDYEQISFRWSDGLIDEKSALRITDPEYLPDTELLGGPNPEIERA